MKSRRRGLRRRRCTVRKLRSRRRANEDSALIEIGIRCVFRGLRTFLIRHTPKNCLVMPFFQLMKPGLRVFCCLNSPGLRSCPPGLAGNQGGSLFMAKAAIGSHQFKTGRTRKTKCMTSFRQGTETSHIIFDHHFTVVYFADVIWSTMTHAAIV